MSELSPAELKQYTKRSFYVLGVVLCGTLGMVAASLAPIPHSGVRIGLILAVACVNASMVAAFLMHIVSERKMVLIVLAFTVFFFIALMALSTLAIFDVPSVGAR